MPDDREPSNVTRLADARTAREPHIHGPARCLQCQYEWRFELPQKRYEEMNTLQCPECTLYRGVCVGHVFPTELTWHCECGSIHHTLTETEAMCVYCGTRCPITDFMT